MHFATKFAAAALAMLLATAPVLAADPTGTWQSSNGESRYKVSYCGKSKQLCAKLTWLRSDARTAQNLPYLNHFVVMGAVRTDENTWNGQVTYAGQTFTGKLIMTSDNTFRLNGCKGMFCQTMNFSRV